jgi:hypothetical protein
MGNIIDQVEGPGAASPPHARCPLCGQLNAAMRFCRHVRWTFDRGDPVEFARFAVETSPYVRLRGHSAKEIPSPWWRDHGDWIVDRVLVHFDATDGYVFGELGALDVLAMEVWKEFHPDGARPEVARQ